MTKTEVSKALNVSEKTVSRYVSAGRLKASYIAGKTGKQLDFADADVEKLRAELATVEVVTPKPRQDSAALARLDSPSGAGQVEALAQLVRAVMDAGQSETRQDAARVSIAEKLLLDLKEAAELSGVSEHKLRAAIGAGELPARRGIGRGWKVQPGALKAWCDGLFAAEAPQAQRPSGKGKK